jgi:plastocyanin
MKLKLMITAALVAGMGLASTPSHAAVIVTAPGAASTGHMGSVPVLKAAGVTYLNLDPLGSHNIVSEATKKDSGPWCGIGKDFPNTADGCPIFYSGPEIVAGDTATVQGTASLAPGNYTFHCVPHSNMTGTLTVVA